MKQKKTFYFSGIPVPQGIMDSLAAKPEDRAVEDFYRWLDEHSLLEKFTTWIDSLLRAQIVPVIVGEKFLTFYL